MSLRVLLVDDQSLVRSGIRRILEHEGHEVIGEGENGRDAIRLWGELEPDVLVLDLTMPEKDGFDTTRELRALHPKARILVVTLHDDVEHAIRVIRAGALGFISKDVPVATLVEAIETVAAGDPYHPDALKDELEHLGTAREGAGVLSDREFQVMCMLAKGLTNREIASKLCISVKTVDTHRLRILRKLELRNNAELARFAVRHGYIEA